MERLFRIWLARLLHDPAPFPAALSAPASWCGRGGVPGGDLEHRVVSGAQNKIHARGKSRPHCGAKRPCRDRSRHFVFAGSAGFGQEITGGRAGRSSLPIFSIYPVGHGGLSPSHFSREGGSWVENHGRRGTDSPYQFFDLSGRARRSLAVPFFAGGRVLGGK